MDNDEIVRKFKKVDKMYNKLFSLLENVFSESEIEEVSRFIDVDEYGLAFDTVTGIFVEEKKVAAPEVICVVAELLVLMQCDEDTYSKFSQFLQCYTKNQS